MGARRAAGGWTARALALGVAPFVLVSGAALAEDAGPDITVLAEPLPASPGSRSYSVELLSREDLLREGAGRLDDVLRQSAGFQLFRRSDSRTTHPTSQGPTLRALGGNAAGRALVLLDGVPQEDPFGGWVPWAALSAERLGHVRITRGGGAGAFGAGALAGTIELFSQPLEPRVLGSARAEYGSRDSWLVASSVQAPLGAGVFSLAGQVEESDGFYLVPKAQRGPVDRRASTQAWHVEARGAVPLGESVELNMRVLGFQDKHLNGLDPAPNNTDGVDASVRLVSRGDWAWDVVAYAKVRQFDSGFASVQQGRTVVAPSLDQYDVPATGLGGKAEVRPPMPDGHMLQLGVDLRRNTGKTKEYFRYMEGAFTRHREAGGDALVAGAYLEHSWEASESVTLTGGARLDYWRQSDGRREERDLADQAVLLRRDFAARSDWQASGRVGASWKPWQAVELRAAAYTGFRMPTLNELYRPFRVGNDITEANPALDPERLRGVEVGLRYQPIEAAGFDITLFRNTVRDAVGNVTVGFGPGTFPTAGFVPAGGVLRLRQNIDKARSQGIEARGHLTFGNWRAEASYAFTDAKVRRFEDAPELEGTRLAQSPRHMASAGLSYTEQDRWGIAASGQYMGKVFEDDLNSRSLSDSFTVDGAAWVMLNPALRLELRGQNLFDATVEAGKSADGILTLAAPRTVWVGLSWMFGQRKGDGRASIQRG